MSKMGRPDIYSVEMCNKICEALANGSVGLAALCKRNPDWPGHTTVYKWLQLYPDFADKYAKAKQEQADFMADEIIEIADDGSADLEIRYDAKGQPYKQEDKEVTNRSRLRIDARKWVAAKLKPKKYGDKLDLTSDGEKMTFNVTLNNNAGS